MFEQFQLKIEENRKKEIKTPTLEQQLNKPFYRFGRQYHLGSKTKACVVQLDWF